MFDAAYLCLTDKVAVKVTAFIWGRAGSRVEAAAISTDFPSSLSSVSAMPALNAGCRQKRVWVLRHRNAGQKGLK